MILVFGWETAYLICIMKYWFTHSHNRWIFGDDCVDLIDTMNYHSLCCASFMHQMWYLFNKVMKRMQYIYKWMCFNGYIKKKCKMPILDYVFWKFFTFYLKKKKKKKTLAYHTRHKKLLSYYKVLKVETMHKVYNHTINL